VKAMQSSSLLAVRSFARSPWRLTLLLALTAGCAAQPPTAQRSGAEQAVAATNEPALIDPAVGPSASPPPPPQAQQRSDDAQTAAQAPSPQAPQSGRDAGPRGWRRDGKPVWWLDAPQRRGDEVVVCAQALGEDVLGARRAAVAAGEAALRRLLGAEPSLAEPLATAVRPLGAAEGPPGAARFAGFVMMRAVVARNDNPEPPRP